jgi:hypothetical protein
VTPRGRPCGLALALVLALGATAGCAEQDGAFDPDGAGFGVEGGDFRLEGTFVRGATADDVREAEGVARAHGAAFETRPDDPPTFVLSGMTQAACEAARADLAALASVDSVGSCSDIPAS